MLVMPFCFMLSASVLFFTSMLVFRSVPLNQGGFGNMMQSFVLTFLLRLTFTWIHAVICTHFPGEVQGCRWQVECMERVEEVCPLLVTRCSLQLSTGPKYQATSLVRTIVSTKQYFSRCVKRMSLGWQVSCMTLQPSDNFHTWTVQAVIGTTFCNGSVDFNVPGKRDGSTFSGTFSGNASTCSDTDSCDTSTQLDTIQDAFDNTLTTIQEVANDLYFGTDDMAAAASELNEISDAYVEVVTDASCSIQGAQYCVIYDQADLLIEEVDTVYAQIDELTEG